jgi:two-component system chemotaxis response regulator CheB
MGARAHVTIRILIVDDSQTARAALSELFASDPELCVVGEAATKDETLRLIESTAPDIVTLDIYLTRESGIDVAAAIMARCARPILLITGVNPNDPQLIYRAMEAGALEVRPKPPGASQPGHAAARDRLIRLVKSLAKVPVVHRYQRARAGAPTVAEKVQAPPPRSGRQVVLFGASTGGPPVLSALFEALPAPFPLPIVVVQHISPGFGEGLVQWLSQTTGHEICTVREPLTIEPGRVFFAADDRHLVFSSSTTITPDDSADSRFQRPSIDVLFESAARRIGANAVAVLMTGMGSDGARGLLALRQAGALTVAQRPETCTIDSMPRHAIDLKAAGVVLSPELIVGFLLNQVPSGRVGT